MRETPRGRLQPEHNWRKEERNPPQAPGAALTQLLQTAAAPRPETLPREKLDPISNLWNLLLGRLENKEGWMATMRSFVPGEGGNGVGA